MGKWEGKKTINWRIAKNELIKIYFEKGITRCENCNRKNYLDFHHRPSRASQEAVHDFEHTRLLCIDCHEYFEHNDEADFKLFSRLTRGFDPKQEINIMAERQKEKESKGKKADWQKPHQCVHCKVRVSTLICSNCGQMSVK